MSLKDKAKAGAKNLEGKVQEAVGNLTGNEQAQAEGQGKQAEAQVLQTVEEVKDNAHKTEENVRHATEDAKHEAHKSVEDVKANIDHAND